MITIGADPEVFVMNPETNKEVSAIGLIGGSKYEPMPTKNGSVQEDNVAAEFNVRPANTALQFVRNIQAVLSDLNEIVEKKKLGISLKSCAHFSEVELRHPNARQAGCDPDFNAWLPFLTQNEAPDITCMPIRSCGGHIHVGSKFKDLEDIKQVIKGMDLFLGVPSILMDTGEERKKLYGKAGCFRPTEYGLEYRTLSNFWIFNPRLIRWVYEQTENAYKKARKIKFEGPLAKRIIHTINENDKKEAKNLIEEWKLEVVS